VFQKYLRLLAMLLAAALAAQAQTTPTGNVGIGTTAPTQKLDVDGQLRVRGLSGANTRLPVVLPDGTLGVSAPYNNVATNTAPVSPVLLGSVATGSDPRSVAVSGATAYVVNNNSNTLQAFQFPPRAVTVNADGSLGSVALPSGAGFMQNGTVPQPNAGFNISGAGTVGGLLTAGSATVSGNVGIGTPTPGQKLEVAGGIKFTGTNSALTFPDGTTQATAATSPNAVLNQTTQQVGASFNIGGDGTVGGTLGIGTTNNPWRAPEPQPQHLGGQDYALGRQQHYQSLRLRHQ
jgi:hypothetical protein